MSINLNIPAIERTEIRKSQLYQREIEMETKEARKFPVRALEVGIDFYGSYGFGRVRQVLDRIGLTREPARIRAYRQVLEERAQFD